jgi:hypothetical protein
VYIQLTMIGSGDHQNTCTRVSEARVAASES